MGLLKLFEIGIEHINRWFKSRHQGRLKESKKARRKMLESLFPEIKNTYAKNIPKNKNKIRFRPQQNQQSFMNRNLEAKNEEKIE